MRAIVLKSSIFVSLAQLLLVEHGLVAQQTVVASENSLASHSTDKEVLFTHNSFDDFAQGFPGDGGANLYVARDGTVRAIQEWDYNRDGNIDVLANNDHCHLDASDLLIYLNGPRRGFTNLLPPIPKMSPMMHNVRWIQRASQHCLSLPALGGGKAIVQDLNRDGWPDIAFCNFVHGWYNRHFEVLLYWGGPNGFSATNRSSLPTLTARGIAAADLNGDDWPDLVLANNGFEYPRPDTSDMDEESYVYWGGPKGFGPENRLSLSTKKATDVAVADLNGDGNADIVFANNSPSEQSLSVYWGSADGPSSDRKLRLESKSPTSLLIHDLNGDGRPDILVGHKNDEPAEIFDNLADDKFTPRQLPIKWVADAEAADLDGDGNPDLVLAVELSYKDGETFTASGIAGMPGQDTLALDENSTYFSASVILWGSKTGFHARPMTKLPTIGPHAVTVHDIDGDGHSDLIFANRQDGKSFDVPSYIYWGSDKGYTRYDRTTLQGFGTMDAVVIDANRDGHKDIALINGLSGKTGDPLDSQLYWGSPQGLLSPDFMTLLPARNPLGSASADLNRDGYPDIVFCNQSADSYLYWGSSNGYSPANRVELPIRESFTCEVADLNRDGYLDLAFSGGRVQDQRVNAAIFWGTEKGFDPENRRLISINEDPPGGLSLGDINDDGHLDMLIAAGDALHILKGGGGDFSLENHTVLPGLEPQVAQLADLNGDGRLDIFLVNYSHRRVGAIPSCVYWNTPDGFDARNKTELTTLGAGSAAISDLNSDGALDIVTAHYNAGNKRSLPCYIYWGDSAHGYRESHRSELPGESVLSVFVADLDRDGFKEIVFFNHTRDNDHAFGSWIYHGSAKGYSESNRSWLPTFGVHLSRFIDIGNIRDRRYEEHYLSPPIQLKAPGGNIELSWRADCPLGSSIRFQIKRAASREELAQSEWVGPTSAESYFDAAQSEVGATLDGAGWIQYKAIFQSVDGSNYPVLHEIAGFRKPAPAARTNQKAEQQIKPHSNAYAR